VSVHWLEPQTLHALLVGWLALGAVVFLALLFVTAPYGRHRRPGWGPSISARVGWQIMEAPAVVVMAAGFAVSERTAHPAALALFILWELHYVHRALIAPRLGSPTAAPIPVAVVAMGFVFNVVNAALQGAWLFRLGPDRAPSWLWGPRFLLGVTLFAAGLTINLRSDAVLRRLRAPGETGYRIPRGGLFELVSCPNYLGEIVEWVGWAVATWSLAGLAFAFWTAANLLPRALAHHRWYRRRFPDYPAERRAIVPFLL
jgi:3-oxo-5-alpha-steroid 4-dehydrogenase 1